MAVPTDDSAGRTPDGSTGVSPDGATGGTPEGGRPRGAGRDGGHPPNAFILGLYGAFARGFDGWFAVSHVIRLLADLGVDGQAVRAAMSRLKRRGVLATERRDGLAGYGLTGLGLEILAEGDRRIYADRGPAALEEGWAVVVFSVPESRRDQRHVLRTRLVWLGFGNLAPGVWIAPSRLRGDLETTLRRLELTDYVDVLEARYHGFQAVQTLVERAWDLAALAAQYERFLAGQRPVLRRWQDRPRTDRLGEADAFADYLRCLTEWRRLPFLDPGLPSEVLPPGWPGHAACAVFQSLRARIEEPAGAWVRAVTASAARATPGAGVTYPPAAG